MVQIKSEENNCYSDQDIDSENVELMRLLQQSQKIIEYEETLGINELLPGEDFKILKKTKRYY